MRLPGGSKGFELPTMVLTIAGILGFILGIVFAFAAVQTTSTTVDEAGRKVTALMTYQRLSSSPDCLSNGEAGTVLASELTRAQETFRSEKAESGPDHPGNWEPDCAYSPNFGYHFHVRDLREDTTWEYGYNLDPDAEHTDTREISVAIDYGDRVNPGRVTYRYAFRDHDPVLAVTAAAAGVQERGGTRSITFENTDTRSFAEELEPGTTDTIRVSEDLCAWHSDAREKRCKALPLGMTISIRGEPVSQGFEKGKYTATARQVNGDIEVELERGEG